MDRNYRRVTLTSRTMKKLRMGNPCSRPGLNRTRIQLAVHQELPSLLFASSTSQRNSGLTSPWRTMPRIRRQSRELSQSKSTPGRLKWCDPYHSKKGQKRFLVSPYDGLNEKTGCFHPWESNSLPKPGMSPTLLKCRSGDLKGLLRRRKSENEGPDDYSGQPVMRR